MKKLLSILIAAVIMLMPFYGCFAEKDGINVIIDGEKIEFDVEPMIINNRTMVPFRKIFEYMGSEVTWNESWKMAQAYCGDIYISLSPKWTYMNLSNKKVELDSPPVIINGRTLVPLRAVADAFSCKTQWDANTKTVYITNRYPITTEKLSFDEKHIRTSAGGNEYLDFTISGNTLKLKGKLMNKKADHISIKLAHGALKDMTPITPGKEFSVKESFPPVFKDGQRIPVGVYVSYDGGNTYTSYVHDTLMVEKINGECRFVKPPVWENNSEFCELRENPVGHISSDIPEAVVALSDEICRGVTDDYTKILKIHDWVCDNIYYDYDYYYNKPGNSLKTAPEEVIESRRTICAGYTALTKALINAQNIPCGEVSGYALGLSSQSRVWTGGNADVKETNHAWNRAFADGRWINIDTTWDSGKKYLNGVFLDEEETTHLYFDITTEFLSLTHKIL